MLPSSRLPGSPVTRIRTSPGCDKGAGADQKRAASASLEHGLVVLAGPFKTWLIRKAWIRACALSVFSRRYIMARRRRRPRSEAAGGNHDYHMDPGAPCFSHWCIAECSGACAHVATAPFSQQHRSLASGDHRSAVHWGAAVSHARRPQTAPSSRSQGRPGARCARGNSAGKEQLHRPGPAFVRHSGSDRRKSDDALLDGGRGIAGNAAIDRRSGPDDPLGDVYLRSRRRGAGCFAPPGEAGCGRAGGAFAGGRRRIAEDSAPFLRAFDSGRRQAGGVQSGASYPLRAANQSAKPSQDCRCRRPPGAGRRDEHLR